MPTLLIRHADLLVTMDDADTRIPDGGLYIVDNVIQQVGPSAELPDTADTVIEARNRVILPGLVNTHHHFYQTLTRNLPAAQDADLFTWLRVHYPDLGRPHARSHRRQHQGRHRRTDALRLHHLQRPHLPLAARRAPRRPDRRRRARWASASTPPAARCPSANRRAACRPTAWSRTRTPSCATRSA